MRHRLTDFDHAVLAALKINAVRKVRHSISRVEYTMSGVNIWPSLHRLAQAGELCISVQQDILFPGTEEYRQMEAIQELVIDLKRGLRDGSIKPEKMKKGTKT